MSPADQKSPLVENIKLEGDWKEEQIEKDFCTLFLFPSAFLQW